MNCFMCNKDIFSREVYNETTKAELTERELCYDCNFWFNKMLWPEGESLRANGQHYHINPDETSRMRGHGGAKFIFRRLDTGEILRSTNVWNQGTVPENFRDLLYDNVEQLYECDHCNGLFHKYDECGCRSRWGSQKRWDAKKKAAKMLGMKACPF